MNNYAKWFVDNYDYYYRKCATCKYYNLNDPYITGFTCSMHSCNRLPLDDNCPKWENAGRRLGEIKTAFDNLIRKYGKYYPRGYYIAMAICEILGLDKTFYYSIPLIFREMYYEEGDTFLKEYDEVGPILAECLKEDERREEIAKELFEHYLKPFEKKALEKKMDEAFGIFLELYRQLKANYNINTGNPRT